MNFNAVNEYDCIANYKVLQAGFNKLNIDKVSSCVRLVVVACSTNWQYPLLMRLCGTANRCTQADQGQATGQYGIYAMVQEVF